MLPDAIRRLSAHRAACKQWSVLIAVAILIAGVMGRFSTVSLLWVAPPLLLLGLADAGYAARQEHYAELLKGGKGNESSALPPSEPALASLARAVASLCALSIWPFYLTLWAIVAGGAFELPRQGTPVPKSLGVDSGPAVPGSLPPMHPASNQGPIYPASIPQRLPNAASFPSLPPVNSGLPPRTPGPGFPRPVTPVNFSAKPPVHTQDPPPTVYYATPAKAPATPAVRQNP